MKHIEKRWWNELFIRSEKGLLRSLSPNTAGIDFRSNDYLGFARDPSVQAKLSQRIAEAGGNISGATGSRLISGHTPSLEEAEAYIAGLHKAESALLFPSGYLANLALFSCLLKKDDILLADERIHRSVLDGWQLSGARRWKFQHNDLNDLERLLKKASGKVLIAVESLYSTEGDFAPLEPILALAEQYNAGVIVDEAHTMGVSGLGTITNQGWQNKVLATVVTYGKAMGASGAAVLGSRLLKNYLVNFASPLIYSTAVAPLQVLTIQNAYTHLEKYPELGRCLFDRIAHFRTSGVRSPSEEGSPIQVLAVPDPTRLKSVCEKLKASGFDVYPFLPPSVAPGNARLRICLHAFNTNEEITELSRQLNLLGYE